MPQELDISPLAVINNGTSYIKFYQIHNQYANYILGSKFCQKTQHADLSLVLSWNRPPVSPQRVPGRLLMHFTTYTHISVCSQTHTEGCTICFKSPPSWLPNAKCLPNKCKHKCINTHIMTCCHFLTYFTEALPHLHIR